MNRFFTPLIILLAMLTACGPENGMSGKKEQRKSATPVQPRISTLVEPGESLALPLGQDIPV